MVRLTSLKCHFQFAAVGDLDDRQRYPPVSCMMVSLSSIAFVDPGNDTGVWQNQSEWLVYGLSDLLRVSLNFQELTSGSVKWLSVLGIASTPFPSAAILLPRLSVSAKALTVVGILHVSEATTSSELWNANLPLVACWSDSSSLSKSVRTSFSFPFPFSLLK